MHAQRNEDEARKVLYITNTQDTEAVRYVKHELCVCRHCGVIVTSSEEWLKHNTERNHISAVLLDDANPKIIQGARDVLKILSRQRPRPIIVVLVGAEDYEHLGDVAADIGVSGVVIHTSDQPMEGCLDMLARVTHIAS